MQIYSTKDLSEAVGISPNTLTSWKNRNKFDEGIHWAKDPQNNQLYWTEAAISRIRELQAGTDDGRQSSQLVPVQQPHGLQTQQPHGLQVQQSGLQLHQQQINPQAQSQPGAIANQIYVQLHQRADEVVDQAMEQFDGIVASKLDARLQKRSAELQAAIYDYSLPQSPQEAEQLQPQGNLNPEALQSLRQALGG